jgi:hypothetical protein
MISNDYLEYLDDFESKFETTLAHESEPMGDSLMKKSEGGKCRDTVPLSIPMIL